MDMPRPSSWQGLASAPVVFDDLVLDMLPAAVYICDAAGALVRYNRKAVELWGRTPRLGDNERFCGAYLLFWPDGRPLPHAQTPMAEVLRSGKPVRDVEVQLEQPDGTRVWVLANISPIFDLSGDIRGAVNCFQDITGRKRAERALQENQAFLRAVIEATPECIKVVAADGTLIQINSAGLRMVEAQGADSVVGRSVFELIAPECREAWRKQHERICRGERLSWAFDLIGLRGTRRQLESHGVPLQLPDGRSAQLAVSRDISQHLRGQQRLRALLDGLPAAVYTTDASGRLTFYNDAAAALWGHRPPLGETTWCGSWRLRFPDGRPMAHDECPMAITLKQGHSVRGEAIAECPDGSQVPFSAFPSLLHDAEGRLIGAVNMLIDISLQKQSEARQALLINELNHRVKNTLATVQSIATHSLRGASSTRQFSETFDARLLALSKVHDLLTRRHWEGASLRSVLSQEFAPYGADSAQRIRVLGEDIELAPRAALTLAMAFHELTTNAAKYGVLSCETGRLEVQWWVTVDHLVLRWCERGGPVVTPPRRRGFGSRLVERSIGKELKGNVQLDFAPEGMQCRISIPLASTQALELAQ